ncbi:hypothetical protein N018_23025 [Pseudomonas syringae CC1557]|uniref:Uncharacterized protein n=1 Tax=Pseudomonas syringae CC1557 TaxID=1357279 RepID=W0N0H0_PSESX|nr:hypothetical protein [Pseudomonas syringae]AHG42940.1 hypothetical protein N018_23025 [Pseudomonas syringae CC1557]
MTNTPIGLISLIVVGPIIPTCIVIAIIANKYVETIETYLPNCSFVQTIRQTYLEAGLLGKVMRGGVIGMILLMPKPYSRRGLISAQEINNLPSHYKRMLTIPLILTCFLFSALMALWAMIYFFDL